MSSSAAFHALTKEITCSLCGSLYKRPHSFAGCGHSFCYTCVTDKLSKQHEGQRTCPTCKEAVSVKELYFNHKCQSIVKAVEGLQQILTVGTRIDKENIHEGFPASLLQYDQAWAALVAAWPPPDEAETADLTQELLMIEAVLEDLRKRLKSKVMQARGYRLSCMPGPSGMPPTFMSCDVEAELEIEDSPSGAAQQDSDDDADDFKPDIRRRPRARQSPQGSRKRARVSAEKAPSSAPIQQEQDAQADEPIGQALLQWNDANQQWDHEIITGFSANKGKHCVRGQAGWSHWIDLSVVTWLRPGKPPVQKVLIRQLLNQSVEIWWPEDKKFYKGTVARYIPDKGKHHVLYDDGEEEDLNMAKEQFQFCPPLPKLEQEQQSGTGPQAQAKARQAISKDADLATASSGGNLVTDTASDHQSEPCDHADPPPNAEEHPVKSCRHPQVDCSEQGCAPHPIMAQTNMQEESDMPLHAPIGSVADAVGACEAASASPAAADSLPDGHPVSAATRGDAQSSPAKQLEPPQRQVKPASDAYEYTASGAEPPGAHQQLLNVRTDAQPKLPEAPAHVLLPAGHLPQPQTQAAVIPSGKKVVVGSGLDRAKLDQIRRLCRRLRADACKAVDQHTTHVIVQVNAGRLCQQRSLKYFQGLAQGCWLVGWAWLEACAAAGCWVPEEGYEVAGDHVALGAPKAARMAYESGAPKLFHGMSFLMGFGYKGTGLSPQQLTELLTYAGGHVLDQSSADLGSKDQAHDTEKLRVILFGEGNIEPDKVRKTKEQTGRWPLLLSWVLDSLSHQMPLPVAQYEERGKLRDTT
ncbi:hypothetical protein WJX82_006986 [Trebouxia sp. C0006]